MILSDALSQRANAEELKEKDRTITLLLEDLFVRQLDMELSQILIEDKHEYNQLVLERLRFLLEAHLPHGARIVKNVATASPSVG